MYKIIIQKIDTKTVEAQVYAKTGTEYPTVEDLRGKGYYSDMPADIKDIKPIEKYGYVNSTKEETKEIKLFEQTVEELDIQRVILAINQK